MTEEEIEKNRNNLIKKFMEKFAYQEALEKKFGRFAPVVLAYYNALLNDYPQASVDIPKLIGNQSTLKYCIGEKVNYQCKGEHIRNYDKKNGNIYQVIHLFTSKNDIDTPLFYHDDNNLVSKKENLSFIDFLENDYSKNIQSKENAIREYKEKLDEIKVFIHEFSHSIANIKIMPFDKKLKQDESRNLYLVGGIPYYFRNQKTGEIYSNKISSKIHEGCTEYITQVIFHNDSMQEYINSNFINPQSTQYHPQVSYKIEYSYVAMCNCLLDNFIIEAYFNDYDTIKNKEFKTNFVSETYYPLGKMVDTIENRIEESSFLNNNCNNKIILSLSNDLAKEIIKIAQTLYSLYTIKNQNLELTQKKCFEEEYSYFTSSKYWKSFINKNTKKLTEKEQELFYNNFKEKLENSHLPNFANKDDKTSNKMQNLKDIIDNMFSNANSENKENKKLKNEDENIEFNL